MLEMPLTATDRMSVHKIATRKPSFVQRLIDTMRDDFREISAEVFTVMTEERRSIFDV